MRPMNGHSARIVALSSLTSKYPYQRIANRLSEAEFDAVVEFIDDNDDLGHLEFEYKVNRMYLFKSRSGHWSDIQELLLATNSRVHVTPKGGADGSK